MGTLLAVLGWALLLAVLLPLAAILVPMRITLQAASAPGARFRLGVAPFWGLVPIRLVDTDRPGAEKRKERRARRKERRKAWRRKRREAGKGISPRRVLDALPGLLRGILGNIRVERVDIDGRFGLPDPAETGEAFGHLTPLLYGIPGHERLRLRLEPVFDAATLSGRADVSVRLALGAMIPAAVRFGWAVFGPVR